MSKRILAIDPGNKRILAIDPGAKGGVATIADGEVRVMPLVYSNKQVCVEPLLDLFETFEPTLIIIERQWTRPGQGGVSSGTTMFNYGKLIATAESYGRGHLITPTPRKWQKLAFPSAKRGDSKKASIAFCKRRYPQVSLLRTARSRKDCDGLSDALCMASIGESHTDMLAAIT